MERLKHILFGFFLAMCLTLPMILASCNGATEIGVGNGTNAIEEAPTMPNQISEQDQTSTTQVAESATSPTPAQDSGESTAQASTESAEPQTPALPNNVLESEQSGEGDLVNW